MAPAADCHRSTSVMRSGSGPRAFPCVVWLAVAGGLTEPVLVSPEVLVQLGPGGDLRAVGSDPRFALPLGGDEFLHVVLGPGVGLSDSRSSTVRMYASAS